MKVLQNGPHSGSPGLPGQQGMPHVGPPSMGPQQNGPSSGPPGMQHAGPPSMLPQQNGLYSGPPGIGLPGQQGMQHVGPPSMGEHDQHSMQHSSGPPGMGAPGQQRIPYAGSPGMGPSGQQGMPPSVPNGMGPPTQQGLPQPGMGPPVQQGMPPAGLPAMGPPGQQSNLPAGPPAMGPSVHKGMPQAGPPSMGPSVHQGMPQAGPPGIGPTGHQGMSQAGPPGMGPTGLQGMPQAGPPGIGPTGHQGMPQPGHGMGPLSQQGMPPAGPSGMGPPPQQGLSQPGPPGMGPPGQQGMPQPGSGMGPSSQQGMPPAGPSGMGPPPQQGFPQPGPPGMGPPGQRGMSPAGPPDMGPAGQQGIPHAGPPGMGPPGQHGMPQLGPPGMGPPGQQGMPTAGHPGMGPPSQHGMPQHGPPGMGPPGQQGMMTAGSPGMGPPGQQGMMTAGPPGMGPPGQHGMPHTGLPAMGPPGQHGMPHAALPAMGPPGQHGMPPPPGMYGQPPGPADHMGSQSRQKLDPNLMPSAVQVLEDDRNTRTGLFQTGFPHAEAPPLVTTDFYCEDQGNCNPNFMRATMYCAPASSDLLKTSAIPFGVSISPVAQQMPQENTLPVVDLGEMGPVRCQRCKAYMCPFMEFQDGGRRFRCPFCKASSDVPQEYFAHLDHQGRRTDLYQRPELCLGSYEFVATKAYCKNAVPPKHPAFIFMLDVSYNAIRTGMVTLFCQNIRSILDHLPTEMNMEKSEVRIGFATYDQTIHFYNLKNSLDQPQMMIVGDINDVFVPMADGFVVSMEDAESSIDSLLQEIPSMFAETRITETLLGPVVQAGMDALKVSDRSGKLFIFHTSLPVLEAPGKLKNRDDRKLLGSDKEKTILSPQTDFYSKLAQECVNNGCCVDLFLFPNSYIDVATIGDMCATTGGQIYKYQYFEIDRDGARFLSDLKRDIERPIVFDAMMRVRTSTGIRPTGFHGCFYMSNTTDIELAAIDCDKAIDVEIRHDDKLEEESAYIQAALLFTSCSGQRRLRIHNLCLSTANNHAQIYRLADQDTVVNFLSKIAESMQHEKSPKDVRDHLTGRCAQILATYRERCSESAPAGQLILPECLKLLPLYTNCLIKHDALAGTSDLTTDDRSWMMQLIPSLKVSESVRFFYPRLLCVSDLSSAVADPNNSSWELPNQIRCSYENLHSEKTYLLENGVVMFLWIGLQTPAVWAQEVFGVQGVTMIDTEKQLLPEKDTDSNRMLRRMIEKLNHNRPRRMKLYIIRQQDKLEPWMKKFFVEDRAAGSSASYVDFLCHIHREIRSILS